MRIRYTMFAIIYAAALSQVTMMPSPGRFITPTVSVMPTKMVLSPTIIWTYSPASITTESPVPSIDALPSMDAVPSQTVLQSQSEQATVSPVVSRHFVEVSQTASASKSHATMSQQLEASSSPLEGTMSITPRATGVISTSSTPTPQSKATPPRERNTTDEMNDVPSGGADSPGGIPRSFIGLYIVLATCVVLGMGACFVGSNRSAKKAFGIKTYSPLSIVTNNPIQLAQNSPMNRV